jgi:hypothetical protein
VGQDPERDAHPASRKISTFWRQGTQQRTAVSLIASTISGGMWVDAHVL